MIGSRSIMRKRQARPPSGRVAWKRLGPGRWRVAGGDNSSESHQGGSWNRRGQRRKAAAFGVGKKRAAGEGLPLTAKTKRTLGKSAASAGGHGFEWYYGSSTISSLEFGVRAGFGFGGGLGSTCGRTGYGFCLSGNAGAARRRRGGLCHRRAGASRGG